MLTRFNSIRAVVLFHRVSQFTSSVYTHRESYIKKIFSALTLAVVSILMFSCAVDKEIDNLASGANENAQLVLQLRTPSGYSVTTRSLSVDDENTINDVYVLVFDKSNELVSIKKGSSVSSSVVNDDPLYSGECSFTVTLKPSSGTGDTYNLVVLANAGSIIKDRIGFTVSTMSEGEKEYFAVINSIYGEITGSMFSEEGDNTIPMSYETGQITISPGNSTDLSLVLTRSVARIDVGVGTATDGDDSWYGYDAAGEMVPFLLKHVYVVNPNNRYAVAPDKKLAAGILTIPTGTKVFTTSGDDSKNYLEFDVTKGTIELDDIGVIGGYTSRDIYVPEADIIMDGSDTSDEDKHTNRMAIVVGGCYDGSDTETFYRLDFADSDGKLMNVLRNHLYRFSISEVLGDGYSDVESAYAAQSKNMTAKVYKWDEEDLGNIAFDGQNYLSVSQSEFNFTCEAIEDKGENNVLSVKTDVTEGWFIEKIVEKDGDVEKPDVSVDWVTVKVMKNGEKFSPVGKANSTTEEKAFLTVEGNGAEAARSAVIWIAAGRMRYPVTVNQSLDQAPGVQITINDIPVTESEELVFVDNNIVPQTLKVKWQPKDAVLAIRSTLLGTTTFTGTGIPNANIAGGTGECTYDVAPAPFFETEIASLEANPFQEKESRIYFTSTSGGSDASSSILLRQIHYDLLPHAVIYLLSTASQMRTINVRANFDWEITKVDDTSNILSNSGDLVVGTEGDYDTEDGTELSFTIAGGTTEGTATITFKKQSDTSDPPLEWPVTITAIDGSYVGMFGGELKKSNIRGGVWKFTKPLYVQKEDEGNSTVRWRTGTTNISDIPTDYTDGRLNTWSLYLKGITSYPAAERCYKKSGSPTTSAADLTWYLPAQKQLMGIYAMKNGLSNKPSAYYWSATENDASNSWFVTFSTGITLNGSKTSSTPRVRCVREN